MRIQFLSFFLLGFTSVVFAQDWGVPSDGLMAYYPLDSSMANNAASDDLQGLIHGEPSTTVDRFGNEEGAMWFEEGDYVTVPGSGPEAYYPFTVSLWYWADADALLPGLKPLFKKYSPAYWRGIQVAMTRWEGTDAVVPWYIKNTNDRIIGGYGSPAFNWWSTAEPQDSIWHHVVFAVDSVGGSLYINGELFDFQPWDGTPGVASSYHEWQFAGTYETGDTIGYIGAIDDIAVWNRALSAGEVGNIYDFDGVYDGCMDSTACNYDPSAQVPDGSCLYVGDWCNDGDANTIGDVLDSTCTCVGNLPVDTTGYGPCQGIEFVNYHGWDYELVEISGMCWFRENLRTDLFLNGDTIPYQESGPQWPSQFSPKRGVWGDSLEMALEYGYLYNFPAVQDDRGLCPAGWMVASPDQYAAVVGDFGSQNRHYRTTGTLESGTGQWENLSSGTNATGFSGQPFGMRDYLGNDTEGQSVTSFWSSVEPIPQSGIRWILGYDDYYPFQNFYHLKSRGSYVRCVFGEPYLGCTDSTACNYEPLANTTDFSCYSTGDACDDGDDMTFDDAYDEACDCVGLEVLWGCTDSTACNFNAEANMDDASCAYPGEACDDGDDATMDDVWNELCECEGEVDGVHDASHSDWALYPNPASEIIRVQFFETIGVSGQLRIADGLGRTVWSTTNLTSTSIPVSQLPEGIYQLVLSREGMVPQTKRFVVSRSN